MTVTTKALTQSRNYFKALGAFDSAPDGQLLYLLNLCDKGLAHHNLAIKALQQIKRNPSGCPRCDKGVLFDPTKSHWDTCGYMLMNMVLTCEDMQQAYLEVFLNADRYFCQRCGKRIGDKAGVWEGVHTCTPPSDL